ncbi:MAG: hypothetical protein ACXW04_01830, partial [Methylobacter sp.]
GYRPPPFPGVCKSGQFICYKIGQFYLLLTLIISNRLTETDLKNLENIGIYGTMRLNTINLKDGDIPHIVKNLNVHYQRMITLDNNNAERRNP